ncbi:Uncharacterised protein [uncultured archaeon]|nr:Uncharacterised protein [uncultured archaeon]
MLHLLPDWLAIVGIWIGAVALALTAVKFLPKRDNPFRKWGL